MRITGVNKLNLTAKILFTLLLLCIPFYVGVLGKTELERFYSRWAGTPLEDIVGQGVKAVKQGDMELALTFFNMAIRDYDKDAPDSDQRIYVQAYLNAGSIYYSEYSDNQQAYNCLMNALEINRRLGVTNYDAYIYANIGNIHIDLNDNAKAMDYYAKALSGALGGRNWYVSSLVASNIFFHALKSGRLEYCRSVLSMLDKVRIPVSDPNGRYLDLCRSVLRSALAGRYGDAASRLEDMIRCVNKDVYEDPVLLIVMLRQSKAYVYSRLGLYGKGLDECAVCEKMIHEDGINSSELKEVYEVMSQLFYGMGDVGSAYDYLKKADSCMTGMDMKSRHSKVSAMQAVYELDKTSAEMDAMKRKDGLRSLVMSVLSVVLIALAALVMVMYRNARRLKRKNSLIYSRTMELLDRSKTDGRAIAEYESRIAACNAEIERLRMTAAHAGEAAAAEADGTAAPAADVAGEARSEGGSVPDAAVYEMMSRVFAAMDNENDIYSPDFSIDKLALSVGSKPKYVSQAINSCCKKNFRTFLSEYRIREVCRRFSEKDKYGGYTIEAIATSVGFNSRSAFITAFKRITGITPSEYMRTGLADKT